MTIRILTGDCRNVMRAMDADSIDCIVTSPPYWGLRDYGIAGQLGLEATLGEHIDVMVDVFEEAKRVLKPTGTCWINYGDCYAASVNGRSAADTKAAGNDDRTFRDKPFSTVGPIFRPGNLGGIDGHSRNSCAGRSNRNGVRVDSGSRLKPKDLCMVPNRLAIALQEAGWWVRAEIIWAKPNPMPESVRDRPTSAHEKIWLLTKQERYFYDAEAIAEKVGEPTRRQKTFRGGCYTNNTAYDNNYDYSGHAPYSDDEPSLNGRNRRNVWTVPSQPFSDAHFATFPPALIEPCILAGCPQKCCAKCGKPWLRKTKDTANYAAFKEAETMRKGGGMRANGIEQLGLTRGTSNKSVSADRLTLGFWPSCHCKADTVPGIVLDPFGGSGTTGMVADRLGRNAILIELNETYAAMAQSRIINDLPLFAEVLA